MKIIIEMDTSHDTKDSIEKVLSIFKIEKEVVHADLDKQITEIIAKGEDSKSLLAQLKERIKQTPLNKTGCRLYSKQFKKDFITFYNLYKKEHPRVFDLEIARLIGITAPTFTPWIKGQNLRAIGGIKREAKTGEKRNFKKVKERNIQIIQYLNNNPFVSWQEASEKFNLHPTTVHNIAKKNGKVKIMNRPWETIVEPTHVYKTPEEKVEEIKKETPVEHFLKFEHSRVNQEDTIKAINECIQKGALIYKEDASKFGYDGRMLPITDWFNFITDVAHKVNKMMGIEVILEDTLTGIRFKK